MAGRPAGERSLAAEPRETKGRCPPDEGNPPGRSGVPDCRIPAVGIAWRGVLDSPRCWGPCAMRDVVRRLTDALGRGREQIVCQVVETRGSTPQKAGALMVVDPGGGQAGTL